MRIAQIFRMLRFVAPAFAVILGIWVRSAAGQSGLLEWIKISINADTDVRVNSAEGSKGAIGPTIVDNSLTPDSVSVDMYSKDPPPLTLKASHLGQVVVDGSATAYQDFRGICAVEATFKDRFFSPVLFDPPLLGLSPLSNNFYSANTSYFIDLYNARDVPLNPTFIFNVFPSKLVVQEEARIRSDRTDDVKQKLHAELTVEIVVQHTNGPLETLYQWHPMLEKGLSDPTFQEGLFDPQVNGSPIIISSVSSDGRITTKDFEFFHGRLSLGTILPGDDMHLFYDMTAQISGPGGLGTGAIAMSGDPFEFIANGTGSIPDFLTFDPPLAPLVPEPSGLVMACLAIAILCSPAASGKLRAFSRPSVH